MTYLKRADIPVMAGELAVELPGAGFAAVRCDRKRVDSGIAYHPQARAITEEGAQVLDARGQPIVTETKHTAPMDQVERIGDDAIARECMLLVLGEPLTPVGDGTLIRWADTTISGCSLRVSIAAAAVAGPADAGAVL